MILDQIKEDLVKALKAKDQEKAGALRFLLSEIRNQEIELYSKGKELSDEDTIEVIRRESKKRKESIEAYKAGNREDLVRKETNELEILSKYLPQGLTSEDLEKIVRQTITELGAAGPNDFGKVMGAVMGKVKGQADGQQVAETVRRLLPK